MRATCRAPHLSSANRPSSRQQRCKDREDAVLTGQHPLEGAHRVAPENIPPKREWRTPSPRSSIWGSQVVDPSHLPSNGCRCSSIREVKRLSTTTVVSDMDPLFHEFERMKANRSVFDAQREELADVPILTSTALAQRLAREVRRPRVGPARARSPPQTTECPAATPSDSIDLRAIGA